MRVDGNELLVQAGQPSAFAFDHCYGPEATQPEVYDAVGRKVLDAAFEGYTGTIFAYGQTGSGKPFTMSGGHDGGPPRSGGSRARRRCPGGTARGRRSHGRSRDRRAEECSWGTPFLKNVAVM